MQLRLWGEGAGRCSNSLDLPMDTAARAMTTSPLPRLGKENIKMKHNAMLAIASLLSILFMTLHLTSDTVHARVGTGEAGGSTLIAVPILVVWLYGTLVLAERRSGYIIMLVGSPPGVGHARHPRDGRGRRFSRPDRQVQPSLLVRLDASRARRDWDLLPHPLGARTVEPATGPAPVAQQPHMERPVARRM